MGHVQPRDVFRPIACEWKYFVDHQYNKIIYYPTLLPRVQISRETSTNNRYLYSPHSSRPREVQNLGKSEFWEKKSLDNLLLDVLVCSIAVYFYSLFTTRKNIQRYYTPKRLIRYI